MSEQNTPNRSRVRLSLDLPAEALVRFTDEELQELQDHLAQTAPTIAAEVRARRRLPVPATQHGGLAEPDQP